MLGLDDWEATPLHESYNVLYRVTSWYKETRCKSRPNIGEMSLNGIPASYVGASTAKPDYLVSASALQPCEAVERARDAERLYVPSNLRDSLAVRDFVRL